MLRCVGAVSLRIEAFVFLQMAARGAVGVGAIVGNDGAVQAAPVSPVIVAKTASVPGDANCGIHVRVERLSRSLPAAERREFLLASRRATLRVTSSAPWRHLMMQSRECWRRQAEEVVGLDFDIFEPRAPSA